MLVATRDPLHHAGAHGHGLRPDGVAPRVARLVSVLQVTGTLLGIPVGLASVYSIYHTNFSVDTACHSLRGNIISMIDKKIDATARRMLVRRDVESFEKSCGDLDPDAKAAFVTLLAAEPRTVPVRAAAPIKTEVPKIEAVRAATPKAEPPRAETPAKDAVHKIDPHPVAVRQTAASNLPEKTAITAPESASSDARWLDAVRDALVSHKTIPAKTVHMLEPPQAPAQTMAPPPAAATPVTAAPLVVAPLVTAPTLPPPATAVPVRQLDTDHPVPPGSVPDTDANADPRGHTRATWISHIPFVGQVLDR
jgi:hypothetical protein